MGFREMMSKMVGDYHRHGGSITNGGFWMLATWRVGNWGETLPARPRRLVRGLYSGMLLGVETLTNARLYRETQIGEDFHIIHTGSIFIDPEAQLGDRVGIMHDVVIGTTAEKIGVPIIEDDVFIGPGARVLGPVRIGKGAKVAANSVVIGDVPPGATAVGVPARVIRYTGATARKVPPKAEAKPEGEAKPDATPAAKPAAESAPAPKVEVKPES